MNFALDDSHSHNIRRELRFISMSPGTASNCFSNIIKEHSGQSGSSRRHLVVDLGQCGLLPQHLLGWRRSQVLVETVDYISCTMTTDWDWRRLNFMLNSMVMNNDTSYEHNWPHLGSVDTKSLWRINTFMNTTGPIWGQLTPNPCGE